jgi:hypothetical protein
MIKKFSKFYETLEMACHWIISWTWWSPQYTPSCPIFFTTLLQNYPPAQVSDSQVGCLLTFPH